MSELEVSSNFIASEKQDTKHNIKHDMLDSFYQNVSNFLATQEETDKFTDFFYNNFLAGDTVLYQKSIVEFKNFDNEWVNTLEMYLPSIQKIIRNPKSTLRFDEEVVPIEKAKRITPASIRHLAQNTQLIKEVDEKENVIPHKILTTRSDIDYAIYENRFIMTLINRLGQFVGNRYEVIRNNIASKERNHINLKSNYNINDTEVKLEIDLEVKSDLVNNELKQRNQKLLARVKEIVQMVNAFKVSEFMQNLKGQKPVLPPIMKTNIILKNPDFRNAYSLWLFLDSYNALIFDIDVQEKDLDIDQSYIQDLNQISLLTYAFIAYNQKARKELYDGTEKIEYTRKATKVIRTDPRDVVENPDGIQMEDNSVNEYYLDQNQKLFKKSLTDLLSSDITYEDAMKRAMTQTMDITNNLFKSVFETDLNIQDDVTKMLVRKTLEEELTDAKRKSQIAKMIREVKENDLKDTIELERQSLKDISDIYSEMVNQKSVKKRFARNKEEIKEFTNEIKENRKQIKDTELSSKDIQESIDELSKFKEALIKEQMEVYQESIKQIDSELIAAEKQRAKLARKEIMEELKRERKVMLENERKMFKEEREKICVRYQGMQTVILEEEKMNRQLALDKLKEQFKEKKQAELDRLNMRASAN